MDRSSDDGTCRIWDATDSTRHSRVYMPNPKDTNPGLCFSTLTSHCVYGFLMSYRLTPWWMLGGFIFDNGSDL